MPEIRTHAVINRAAEQRAVQSVGHLIDRLGATGRQKYQTHDDHTDDDQRLAPARQRAPALFLRRLRRSLHSLCSLCLPRKQLLPVIGQLSIRVVLYLRFVLRLILRLRRLPVFLFPVFKLIQNLTSCSLKSGVCRRIRPPLLPIIAASVPVRNAFLRESCRIPSPEKILAARHQQPCLRKSSGPTLAASRLILSYKVIQHPDNGRA